MKGVLKMLKLTSSVLPADSEGSVYRVEFNSHLFRLKSRLSLNVHVVYHCARRLIRLENSW